MSIGVLAARPVSRGRSCAYRAIQRSQTGEEHAPPEPAGIATACSTCHGPDLLGMAGTPPLAGRSPAGMLRQLVSFRTGARADSASVVMRPIVNALTVDDMAAVAAYLGSLPPQRGTKH